MKYKGIDYPDFQAEGYAAQFAIPFAKHVCKGSGVDIGSGKKEWAFPGSLPVDINFLSSLNAINLPNNLDYIFSSHCLEHIDNYVEVMEYWHKQLCEGGVLFLYLPHYDQEYWRPWNNKKHKHAFTVGMIRDLMIALGYHDIFFSERDLNHSFMIYGTK